MITPEPMPLPFWAVTSTSTTAGRTRAITASRIASILFPLSGGSVATVFGPLCRVDPVDDAVFAVPLPNCQPANRPTPRVSAKMSVNKSIAPVRGPPEVCLGVSVGCSAKKGEGVGVELDVVLSTSGYIIENLRLSFKQSMQGKHICVYAYYKASFSRKTQKIVKSLSKAC